MKKILETRIIVFTVKYDRKRVLPGYLAIGIGVLAVFLFWFWAVRPAENEESTTIETNETTSVDNIETENGAEVLSESSTIDTVKGNEEAEYQPSETADIKQAGYIAYWDYQGGISHYEDVHEEFSEVLPTWYYITESGSLSKKTSTACDKSLVDKVHGHSDIIVPSVSTKNSDELSAVLNNPDLTNKFVNEVQKEIARCNYDGIDIDFESIHSYDKQVFTDFIENLSKKLHKGHKILSVAVKAKTENPVYFVSNTRKAQDWEALGRFADRFKIMVYDFTKASGEAGPNSPNHWLEDILRYAVKHMPKEKIQIGLPYYAYIWEYEKEGTGISKTKLEMESLFASSKRKKISEKVDQESGERVLIYETGGKKYISYWNSGAEISAKKAIIKSYGVDKCFYWRL